MAKDTDRAYGALGFEFHQNRLKKFKKGEVVLCMGVGNNYDLPFGWESPFIYSKFVHVFDEHFVATEDGRFSIDRIFKVDKEYRFHEPHSNLWFISYFRMNVKVDRQYIHFDFIDKNPTKDSFTIPVDAGRDYIKNQLAYTDGIKLFELRKSSKNVATKKVKPVKVISVENEPADRPMEKGNFFYTSNSSRIHQFKSFEFDEDIEGEYDDIYKPLITINAVYVMDGQKSYFNHYNIKNGKLKQVSSLEEIIIVKEPIKVEIKFMPGTRWYLLWLNNGTNNDNILISGLESKSIAIEKAKKFGFEIVATKSIKPVAIPSAGQEPEPEAKNETTSKRDKNSQKRDEMIKFRVTSEVKELIQELAKHDQCTVAELLKNGIKKYAMTSIRFKTSFDFSKLEIIK